MPAAAQLMVYHGQANTGSCSGSNGTYPNFNDTNFYAIAAGQVIRFKWSDDDVQDTNAAIVQGANINYDGWDTGNNPDYSYWAGLMFSWPKYLKLYFLTPPLGSISNLRFWVDKDNLPTGIHHYAGATWTYKQPVTAGRPEAGVKLSTTLGDLSEVPALNHYGENAHSKAAPCTVYQDVVLSAGQTGFGIQPAVEVQIGVDAYFVLPASGQIVIGPFKMGYRYRET